MGTYYDSTTGRTYTYTGSFANGTAVFVDEVPPTAGGNYSGGGSGGSGGGSTNNTTNTTPKPTITGKLDNTKPITGSESTMLMGDDKGTTFTESNITPSAPTPSTPVTPTPTDNSGNTDNTNNILNTPLAETIISAVTGEDKKPNNTNPAVRPAQRYAQSVVNQSQTAQSVYNPASFALGSAPAFVGQFNYLHNARDKNGDDIALKTLSNAEAANVIYNDVDAGIYRFDSKAEANEFLQTLHENDYDFGDTETEFYDSKGNFVGFLGSEAFPYAVVVPEQRTVDVQLFMNTGGTKGGSPAKGSSWTDTPSPKKTSELSEDFDFIYSSRNNTNAEIRDLLELKGIDESWYDGKVGQNPLGGYTGSGRDARESTIKISDVKSGKTTAVQLMDNFGSSDIAEINYGFKIETLPKTLTAEKVKRGDPYADGTFTVPNQSDTILNNPFEIIGTLIGVGALASIGGKIGGSMIDNWVSTGGKVMSGSNIVSHSTRPILGGSRAGKTAEYVTKTGDKYKLAEIGFGAGIGGIFAGKEIESGNIDFSEIIPQKTPQSEVEAGGFSLIEIIPTERQSELSVNINSQSNPFSINAGSVVEVERVREKEKTKQKDEGFSYADVPSYTVEEKIRLAKEAHEKYRQQEIEWEREQERQRQKTKEEYSVVNEAELPPVILEIGGKNPVIEIGGKENIIHDKQRENVTEFEKIIHGREHEHTRENMFGDWAKWAEQTRNLERNSLIQSNNFRINNSEMVSNRFAHSSPYLFDFVNDNQNEDKRRRKDRDERRKRTGSGEINFYRTVVPVGDFGLFRESKREKSRKIGTENYSFIEIDGHRKTKRTRKMKPQQRQNFGFRPIKPFGGLR